MLATSLKKVSQTAAVAAFGVAMVAAAGAAPASAVTLQKYDLNVNFGTTATASGYYILDKERLPLQPSDGFGIPLVEWDVSVINSAGDLLDRFYNSLNPASANFSALYNTTDFGGIFQAPVGNPESLSFSKTQPIFKQLTIQFPTAGFTGVVNTSVADYVSADPNSPGLSTAVTGGGASSTAVPEPITLTGTAVAGVMGLWMKRKQKASKAA